MNYLCIHTAHTRHFSALLSPHPFRILLCLFPLLLSLLSSPLWLTPLRSVMRNLSSRCLSSRSQLGMASWKSHVMWIHVVNSSSHLNTGQFLSLKSHVIWKIHLPISIPASSYLWSPMSCGKFVFPSHYLPLPILEVPSPVVNSSSHLTTCHFPSPVVNSSSHLNTGQFLSLKSHVMW